MHSTPKIKSLVHILNVFQTRNCAANMPLPFYGHSEEAKPGSDMPVKAGPNVTYQCS